MYLFKNYFLPLAFYAVIAILFTWPIALNLSNQVILAESGDVWQHLWNNWWMRFSLLELGTQPYTTPLLFHPTNPNLFFHALDPIDGYLSTPLQLLVGNVAAFNLLILFQVTMAGFGTYLLARYLTNDSLAAFVAGIIYACSPLESRLINLGQLELSSIEWLPFYILCFLKALNGEKPRWLWRAFSVILLLILSLNTWYYLLYAVLFSLVYSLYRLWQTRQSWRQAWLPLSLTSAGIMSVYGILILPILLPTLREAGKGGTQQPIFNVIYNSTTIKGLFTTGQSLLWGAGDSPEFRGNFLGYFALTLAIVGLATGLKQNWFWGVLALIFVGLAFGPVLHFSFDPDWRPETANNGIPLPGKLIYSLPFGNIARVPLRYTLITMLALAILAAYGLSWLTNRFGKKQAWLRFALPILCAMLIFLEFAPGTRSTADASIPKFYSELAKEGQWNDFAVLETPDRSGGSIISRAMFFQTEHAHPMVGGYLSRKPDYSFRNLPGINELLGFEYRSYGRDIIDRGTLRNTMALLNFYKIRYVILHPNLIIDPDIRFNATEILKTVFGNETKPYYDAEGLQVWRASEQKLAGKVQDLLITLGDGWGGRNDTPSGATRQVGSEAKLVIFNPNPQPLRLKINVPIQAISKATSLKIKLNEQIVSEQTIAADSPSVLSLTLELQTGLNTFGLNTNDPINVGVFSFVDN